MTRWVVVVCLLLGACAADSPTTGGAPTTTTPTTATTTTMTTATTATTITTATTAPPPERVVIEQAWVAFGVASDVTLHYPARRVERIGLHQSNDEGAQPIAPMPSAVPVTTMETRNRKSDPNSSADVVVDPAEEIRSPVSGTVIDAGSYNLYCDLDDYFITIEPDEHPGWKVRVLHLTGLEVSEGERVSAGTTVIAPGSRQLPFSSDVDELRVVDPPWPHVHIEVADPAIPNVTNPGSGYENC